jgi:hypothetical protein
MPLFSALLAVAVHVARAAGPCEGALEAALRQELPAGDGDLSASLEFRAGAWQLKVRGAAGEPELHRSLRLPHEECALAAQTAALAIERYVRALPRLAPGPSTAALRPPQKRDATAHRLSARAAGATTLLARSEQAQSSPVAVAPSALASPFAPAPGAPAPSAAAGPAFARAVVMPGPIPLSTDLAATSRATHLVVSTGAAAQLGGDDLRGGLWVDLSVHIPRWAFSLSFARAEGEADAPLSVSPGGEQSLSAGLLALSAKPCLDSWVTACAGPFVAARSLSGSTLRHGREGSALAPEVGGALQLGVPLARGFGVSIALLGGVPLGHSQQTAGPVDLTMAFTVGYRIF